MTTLKKSLGKGMARAEPVSVFRNRRLPVPAHLVGYSALIDAFELQVPLHHELAAVSPKNIRRKEDSWIIYPNAMMPGSNVVDHLVFALKHEGVQLLTLKHVFMHFDKKELEQFSKKRPTSTYIRRLCFFYEWLLEKNLNIPNVAAGAYIDALDNKFQYTSVLSFAEKRFRVRDNLPGTNSFCPTIFKTHKIDAFIEADLSKRAKTIIESAPRELIARAAAFLLLSDSKASFAIEGENPSKSRIARWGSVIAKAGQIDLNTQKLVELQKKLIGDDRFVKLGLRTEGGFVGRHDSFGHPLPEHISANAADLEDLLKGLEAFEFYARESNFHPVLAAACIAFGFVYIHPFEDGNGRLHRFLLHHVLSRMNYTPAQIVFPISSVILDEIIQYKGVLEAVSRPLLELIEWKSTDKGNVEVNTNTGDLYRYFDATIHSEFLFRCLLRAVEKDLPEELEFLERRDNFHQEITHIVDMSERKLDLLLKFLRQGHGSLSKRARENEFAALTENETRYIEQIYAAYFGHGQDNKSVSN